MQSSPKAAWSHVVAGAAGAGVTLLAVGIYLNRPQAEEPVPAATPRPMSVIYTRNACAYFAAGPAEASVVAKLVSGRIHQAVTLSGNFAGFGQRTVHNDSSDTPVTIDVVYHPNGDGDAYNELTERCGSRF